MKDGNNGFVSLGDVWGGKSEGVHYSEADLAGVNMLVPPDVPDKLMVCGGRVALHESLIDRESTTRPSRREQCADCNVVGCGLRIV